MTTLDLTPTARSARGATPALPSVLTCGVTRVGVELKNFFRSRDAMIWCLAYPLFMYVIFNAVMSGIGEIVLEDGSTYQIAFARFFLPAMIATGIMLTSFQAVGSDISLEREYGTLRRLSVTPIPKASYFIGKIGLVLVTAAIQVALLVGVAAIAYDVPLPTDPAAWLRFAWLFVLGLAVGTLCGIAFSSVLRSPKSGAVLIPAIALVLQFISGIFFDWGGLPNAVQWVASAFPLRWIALGMRSVFLPEQAAQFESPESWMTGWTALVLAAWLVVMLLVAVRTFKWRGRNDG